MSLAGFGDSLNWRGSVPSSIKGKKKTSPPVIHTLIFRVNFSYADIGRTQPPEVLYNLDLEGTWEAPQVAEYFASKWNALNRPHRAWPVGPVLRFDLGEFAQAHYILSAGRTREGLLVPPGPDELQILPGLYVSATNSLSAKGLRKNKKGRRETK